MTAEHAGPHHRRSGDDGGYEADSLTLLGAVSMGTGVMIGAGIFALTGQVAELAGALFPLAFVLGAVVSGLSAYSYVKLSNAYPSAGGIAMFLEKAYGRGTVTGACALLMAFSMVINESLVARTFGTYATQLFDLPPDTPLTPALGVGLILFAFGVNLSGNRAVGGAELVMALVKIGGVALFAIAGLWLAGATFDIGASLSGGDASPIGFLAATALAILAYKGFTTITNSGSEIVDPHKNVGRAIMISLGVCTAIYALVALAVAANLSIEEIIQAKDFALAQAARPLLGDYGLWFTVLLAILATASGLIASVFAVSRMLAMLTDMKLVPHKHFGMPGRVQKHTLVYTIVIAAALTIFFDLSRIAALGAVFYLVMDIAVHWGVLARLRGAINANPVILVAAIALDSAVLAAFLVVKARSDMLIIWIALAAVAAIFAGERWFIRRHGPRRAESRHDR